MRLRIIIAFIPIFFLNTYIAAQVMPNDLIFTTSTHRTLNCPHQYDETLHAVEIYYSRDPCYRNALAWLYGSTMDTSIWYSSSEIFDVRALGWSPDGKTLAIFQQTALDSNSDQYIAEICLLNRSGEILICLEDVPAPIYTSPYYMDVTTVTWSPDSSKIYFMAYEDVSSVNDTMLEYRLVEADALTGQTLKTIYQYKRSNEDFPEYQVQHLLLSPRLTHIFVNAGVVIDGGNRLIVNLVTKHSWSLDQSTLPERWVARMTFGLDPRFSPNEQYLVLSVNVLDENKRIVLERRAIVFSANGQ